MALGAAFVYKPEWLTLYLRTTMTAIETGAASLPYPWGDRLEVILRGIGGSVWMQFAFAIVVVRVTVWLVVRRLPNSRSAVGKARAKKLSKERRVEIARSGRLARSKKGAVRHSP